MYLENDEVLTVPEATLRMDPDRAPTVLPINLLRLIKVGTNFEIQLQLLIDFSTLVWSSVMGKAGVPEGNLACPVWPSHTKLTCCAAIQN